MGESKDKGDLLEELVALTHEVPGVSVERRVRVPVLGKPSETREIDVLVSGAVAGYPFRVPIECKNWEASVGVEVVDGFIGKLSQVGIPSSAGVIVSTSGYTSGAVTAAGMAGIRLLNFEGLTPDRLDQVVGEAFQTLVYVTLDWHSMSHFSVYPFDAQTQVGFTVVERARQEDERLEAWGIRAVWEVWRDGKIDLSLGEKTVLVRAPAEGAAATEVLIVEIHVHGHAFTATGKVRIAALRNSATEHLEKTRVSAEFDEPRSGESAELTRLTSEDALQSHSRTGSLHVMLGRVRVPRMASRAGWYPPSPAALRRFVELQEKGEEITLESVEGTRDIRRAWDEPLERRDLVADEDEGST